MVGIDIARLNQLFHFGNCYASGGRHHGIEITRCFSIHKITQAVASPRLHEGKIGCQRALEDIRSDPEVVEAVSNGATLASVPLICETGRPVKANLSIDAGVLAAIDAEAARRKLTRSAFIELLARHALPDLAG